MRLPSWDELQKDADQLDVLEHPLDQPLFVAGPPGSGKTVLAVRRAQLVSDQGKRVPIVTFNRMLRRLLELLGATGGTGAHTMHSFVFDDLRARTGSGPAAHGYDIEWDQVLAKLEGHRQAGPRWDHIVVDEGQDLPRGFFQYVSRHGAPGLSVFADDDQALSERRTTLEQIRAAAGLPQPRILTKNHRNAPEIAAVAEHFHAGRLPAAVVQRATIRERPRLVRSEGLSATAERIARWYEGRGGSIGVIVDRNTTLEVVQSLLQERLPRTRVDAYQHQHKNEAFIDVLQPGVTILNRESVKGQEFDTVFILELESFVPCLNETMRRVMYMLCARARDFLMFVYGPGELSPAAAAGLPPAHLMERA